MAKAKTKTKTRTKTKRGSGKRTRRVRDTKRAITTGVRVAAVVRGPKQKQNTGRPRKKAQRGVRAHATASVPERRGRRRQPEGRAVGAGPSAERRQPAESGRARGGQRALAAAPKGGSRRVREAGPSLPLRDLVRSGMPRSPKAGQGQPGGQPTPWVAGRMKTGHGLKDGGRLVQSPPGPRDWLGLEKPDVRKR